MRGTITEKTEGHVMVAPDYDAGSRYAFQPDQMSASMFGQLAVGDAVVFAYHTPESSGRMVLTGKVAI